MLLRVLVRVCSYAYSISVVTKQKPPSNEREERRKNWLAPAGSPQERGLLEKWASQPGLTEKDRALVYAWLSKPDGFEKRNALFWQAAKKEILGPVVYAIALERHRKLSPDEWLVACLIAHGLKQVDIPAMAGKSLPSIEKNIASIKNKIMSDLKYDIETVTVAQIARWFFGL
jgi:hypothetical protein